MKMRMIICGLVTASLPLNPILAKKSAPIDTVLPFSAQDAQWSIGPGTGKIAGSALLRTRGGDVKTCGALTVRLVPSFAYSDDRIRLAYGNTDNGVLLAYNSRNFAKASPEFDKLVRSTTCDASGNFEFEDLPAGTYYVVAQVYWSIPGPYASQIEGGFVMQRVDVAADKATKVIVTSH